MNEESIPAAEVIKDDNWIQGDFLKVEFIPLSLLYHYVEF